jgi:FkbM family methyltransferase
MPGSALMATVCEKTNETLNKLRASAIAAYESGNSQLTKPWRKSAREVTLNKNEQYKDSLKAGARRIKRYMQAIKTFLGEPLKSREFQAAALEHQRDMAVNAVEQFYLSLHLPQHEIPHCRFSTKKDLMRLYSMNVVYDRAAEEGCIFVDLEHNINLFLPFVGFDEYVKLCADAFTSYSLKIRKPFILIDIGANMLNTALLFAQKPLCAKVFSYEIVPETYELSRKNLLLNPSIQSKIVSFNFGLYNANKEIDVTYYPIRPGASGVSEKLKEEEWLATTTDHDFIAPGSRKHFMAHVKEACAAITENRVHFQEHELVIKIDAENSEFEILENLQPLFDKVYCIFTEIHSSAAHEKIMALFKHRNFDVEFQHVVVFYNRDRITL